MDQMVLTLSPAKYGRLLARTLPKRIENDAEFDHFIETMEELSRAIERGEAGHEEQTLHSLLSTLVREYDERGEQLPTGNSLQVLQFLMEQRALRPVDLTPIFGARSVASLVLSGKRKLSKTHIRRLAEFFHVSPVVFLDEE
jgi:HTH-type transcriptional regulator/antitoxin HigA